jgi:hypothetical protein
MGHDEITIASDLVERQRYRLTIRGYERTSLATFLGARNRANGETEYLFRTTEGGSAIERFALTSAEIVKAVPWELRPGGVTA